MFKAQTESITAHEGLGYPRPQFVRHSWISLDGPWHFAIDAGAKWRGPRDVTWDREIRVPFAPETGGSGVGDLQFYKACWYRRGFDPPRLPAVERLFLHFGAVDYIATVWINNVYVTRHTGGYTPFSLDITDYVGDATAEIVVRAEDDPQDLAKPRGKQDWRLEAHSIWYPRTSGIWQSVWLERVPITHISKVRWTPHLARWEIAMEASIKGEVRNGLRLKVRLSSGSVVLADDTYSVVAGEVSRRIALSDPGVDDSRNDLLWSPDSPHLIKARLELWGRRDEALDAMDSYTALRTVSTQGDRVLLNGRPYPLRMVLDQGYWPETGLTPPNDEAVRHDVELAKAMGFNAVRKHQKIESPRYLYWADVLGLLVWEEMPSAYRFTRESIDRTTREWMDIIDRDYSHPSVMAWVPFNESWGVPNLPDSSAERDYVHALYHLTKTLDPTRPVIGNDGWESVATDIIGIHDYDDQPERIARRYHADDVRRVLFRRERPGGRLLVLEGHSAADHPIVLSEFGGLMLSCAKGSWGYSSCETPEQLAERYAELLKVVRSLDMLSGFCYTQFADTYQEANGLLFADRTPKIPLEQIAGATRGPRGSRRIVTTSPASTALDNDDPENTRETDA